MYELGKLSPAPGSTGAVANTDEPGLNPVPGRTGQSNDLLTIVERLESIVEEETSALAEHRLSDLTIFTRKKSQILLEVTRLTRLMNLPVADARLQERLHSLKSSLDINRSTLEIHLKAAKQLTNVISDAVQAADSDGTYSSRSVGDRFI